MKCYSEQNIGFFDINKYTSRQYSQHSFITAIDIVINERHRKSGSTKYLVRYKNV